MEKVNQFIQVLGVAQDGGYPHLGCHEKCCVNAWKDSSLELYPSNISYIDTTLNKMWLFDVTPKLKEKIQLLNKYDCTLSGIFITHAHYGHYAGLLELGLEVLNAKSIPVYVMPEMYEFLLNNEPFKSLNKNKNIILHKITDEIVVVNESFKVEPFLVNHRNELSETVGFKIYVNDNMIIYLPDIDNFDIIAIELKELIKESLLIFLDGTFYSKKEVIHRSIKDIPHPEIKYSIELFSDLNLIDRKKIHFIHFNHTNPIINHLSKEYNKIKSSGYSVSCQGQIVNL